MELRVFGQVISIKAAKECKKRTPRITQKMTPKITPERIDAVLDALGDFKACVNCKHSYGDKSYLKCDRTDELDPVTGEKKSIYCSTERMTENSCGKDGQYFVSK